MRAESCAAVEESYIHHGATEASDAGMGVKMGSCQPKVWKVFLRQANLSYVREATGIVTNTYHDEHEIEQSVVVR